MAVDSDSVVALFVDVGVEAAVAAEIAACGRSATATPEIGHMAGVGAAIGVIVVGVIASFGVDQLLTDDEAITAYWLAAVDASIRIVAALVAYFDLAIVCTAIAIQNVTIITGLFSPYISVPANCCAY